MSTRWVEESLEAGWCQDEAAFEVSDDDCGGQTACPGDAAAAATAAAAAAVRRSAPAPAAATPSAMMAEETTRLSDLAPDGSMGVPGVPPTESTGGDAPPGGLPQQQQQRGPSRLQRGASLADAATSRQAAAAAIQQQQQQQQAPEPQHQQYQQLALPAAPAHAVARQQAAQLEAQLEDQLDWDDDTPTFLDAVRLRLLGCTPLESRECLGLVRQGAAKRYADWRDDINHVVVSWRQLALRACLPAWL